MKRLTFGFLVAMLVVFTGCSQKDVEVAEETKTEQANKSADKKEQTTTQQSVEPMQSETQTEQTNSTQNAEPMMEAKKEMAKTDEKKKAPKLNNIYFDFDKFVIRNNMRDVLRTNYSKLDKSEYTGTITLEGHCDERGSDEYNFALGLKRAQTVKSELIEYGVNPSQIKIMSYGENKPLCTKQSKNCWSKNRRVVSVLD